MVDLAKHGPQAIRFNVLLYRCPEDRSKIVAHCLEFDVVAVDDTKRGAAELIEELISDLFATASAAGKLGKIMRPAPRKYWEMLANAKPFFPHSRPSKGHGSTTASLHVGYAMVGS